MCVCGPEDKPVAGPSEDGGSLVPAPGGTLRVPAARTFPASVRRAGQSWLPGNQLPGWHTGRTRMSGTVFLSAFGCVRAHVQALVCLAHTWDSARVLFQTGMCTSPSPRALCHMC